MISPLTVWIPYIPFADVRIRQPGGTELIRLATDVRAVPAENSQRSNQMNRCSNHLGHVHRVFSCGRTICNCGL